MKTNEDYGFDENYADISLRVKIKSISENHSLFADFKKTLIYKNETDILISNVIE